MATAERMLFRLTAIVLASALVLTGCSNSNNRKLVAPNKTLAPYDTLNGDVLWAVVPVRNESGTSLVDPLEVTDDLVAAATQTEGVSAVPTNRTLQAMHALELRDISSPAAAKQLAEAMGVDGVLVGTITAWDPYEPVIGLSMVLYARPGAMYVRGPDGIDTQALTYQPTDLEFERTGFSDRPIAAVNEHLDGKNDEVLMQVRDYAMGRHDPRGPSGWERYLKSMPLYSEFAAHYVVRRLVEQEWVRLSRQASRADASSG